MDEKARHILDQVTRMYQRYGIKSVTMDDAAHRLGISKKTLYEYFHDKEELVRNVIIQQHEKRDQFLQEIRKKNLNAVQELIEVYLVMFNMLRNNNPSISYDTRKYYPELYTSLREKFRKSLYDAHLRNITKGKKEGLFRKDLNARIISKLFLYRIENLLESELFTSGEISSSKVFHELFVYHINGLLSEKGRKYFSRNFHLIQKSLDQPMQPEETGKDHS